MNVVHPGFPGTFISCHAGADPFALVEQKIHIICLHPSYVSLNSKKQQKYKNIISFLFLRQSARHELASQVEVLSHVTRSSPRDKSVCVRG